MHIILQQRMCPGANTLFEPRNIALVQTNKIGTQMGFNMPKLTELRQRRVGDARDDLYSARRRRLLDVRGSGHSEDYLRRWEVNTDKPPHSSVSYMNIVGDTDTVTALGAHAREVRNILLAYARTTRTNMDS